MGIKHGTDGKYECKPSIKRNRVCILSWEASPIQQPSFVECLDGSAAWLASATNHLGEPVAHEDATASKELGSGNIEWRDAAGELALSKFRTGALCTYD